MSNPSRKLLYAIIQFLKSQLEGDRLSGECAEGVEVGIQCLEAAYNLNPSEPSLAIPSGLLEIFEKYLAESVPDVQDTTPQNKAQAETLKNEGNSHMSAQNFVEAVACYSKAIKLDPKNAVYYCNRAAATNKLGNYEHAIEDCKTALKIDPNYCKAYGRLGLAYSSMNRYQEAVENYKKALELDPDNDSYKTNLKLAQDSLGSTSNTSAPVQFQNADLALIFTNPNLINMASQMLANPSMQHMMNNILTGNMNQEGGGGGGIDVLLQASQQLAQQMEHENPALVEQLRQHISGNGGANGGGNSEPAAPRTPEPEGQ